MDNKQFLSLITRYLNEPFLEEFVEYYMAEGVDHIFVLYDVDSTIPINDNVKNNVKFSFFKKRPGDLPRLVCTNKKAKLILGWEPKSSKLKKIIVDEFYWQNYLKKHSLFKKTIY